MIADTRIVTITTTHCGVCGITFGLDTDFKKARQEDGRGFWCPNGHTISWASANKEKHLKEQLAAARSLAQRERDRRETATRSANAYKGQVTKIKRRIGKGVCPCCNRSFQNLHDHMAGEHPDYAEVE